MRLRCATSPPMEPLAHIRRHGGESVWTATGHERPVFLDEHGRRRRWVLAGGVLTGGASALWLGALVAGAIGFSGLPAISAAPRVLAERASDVEVALAGRHRPVRTVHARHRSAIERATGLAVSRALISAQ